MKLRTKLALMAVACFTLGFFIVRWLSTSQTPPSTPTQKNDGKEIDVQWNMLKELDLQTGNLPQHLQFLNGARIKAPGFMIPLEDSQKSVSEFLLVPSPMACIHVPPPPPNQVIHVRMAGGARAETSYGPIWIYGRLRLEESSGSYGKSSYFLVGEKVEPY